MNKHNVAGFIIGVVAFVAAFLLYEQTDNIVFAVGTYALTVLVAGGAYAAFGPK